MGFVENLLFFETVQKLRKLVPNLTKLSPIM